MFNPTAVVIDAFVKELTQAYLATYSNLEPDYPGVIGYVSANADELMSRKTRTR